MAAITSTGLGSGLDINGLVSKIMSVESQPLKQLDSKEAGYQAKLASYGQVKSALSSFQSAVSGLESASSFQSIAASSGDSSVYTASVTADAVPGTYAIEVTKLAQSQKLASSAVAVTSDVVGTGTLTFQFGTDNGGVFTANANKAAQSVVIDSTHNSLAGIRDAINSANIGVSATIINDGTGYKLSITSKDTGAANSLKITVTNDSVGTNADSSGLSMLAYDPAAASGSGKNMAQTVAAQDALLNIDGITNISNSSNTITDAIQGVTLNLLNTSATGVSAALNVTTDTTSIENSVQKFVSSYNDLNKTLGDLTAYDATTQQGGVLLGDATILSLQRQMRSLLTTNVNGLSGNYKLLSNIGVSFQKDGTLALDSSKFQAAISASPTNVAALFATVGNASDSLTSYVSATGDTKPGNYSVSVTQLATQGYLDGVSTSSLANTNGTFTTPLVIDGTNNTLALMVDGVQTGTISLTQGSYANGTSLAAEIQSKINGDSALVAADSSVTVSFDATNSKLRITSDRYGSASNASITSVGSNTAATLGLDIGGNTAVGVDVAGTINGFAAAGSGQYLTGSGNDAAGIKLQITGGALGDRGTVSYSQGYAQQIDKFVKQALGATGAVNTRTDGINKSVADIGKQRDALNVRLAALQKRYLAEFNAMDTLVAQMRSTSDFLTQQLAGLASLAQGK